jgi:dihydrofolate reductase
VARLIYAPICSLDGYVADASGDFRWSAPDEEVHAAVNDLVRPVGTQLLGRRMYEVLAVWDTMGREADDPSAIVDFADLWARQDKVVYSTTLSSAPTARTRIEPAFDPAAVRDLKQSSDRDLSIGGPELAAHAIRAGLVDEYHLFVNPVIVGGGTAALPHDVRLDLELVDERRFANGVVHLAYRSR